MKGYPKFAGKRYSPSFHRERDHSPILRYSTEFFQVEEKKKGVEVET
ncbi:hypothetical protein SAMN02745220_05117 [Desulfopila aestuarii DSM 18488]|uniref:Uncharacterized protein n=1 Tax=Desulfopila aestuarii DSM 18488 TaxID=1121416 RepID=A0A1M7YLE2_9BACT|nr:hypothetical protein SAMN02745220_05117 [Desulfopila aestuarii DSM 18488]